MTPMPKSAQTIIKNNHFNNNAVCENEPICIGYNTKLKTFMKPSQ